MENDGYVDVEDFVEMQARNGQDGETLSFEPDDDSGN
jgi:hypothetical protein